MAGQALALANQLAQQRQWQAALDICEQINTQLPRFAAAWLLRFSLFDMRSEFVALERAADACLQVFPRFVPALLSKGTALRMQQQPLEALSWFEKALALESGNARILYHLGLVRKELRDFDGALQALERCIALDPYYAIAYWTRADILKRATPEVVGAMRKVLKSPRLNDAERASLHYALARAYEMLGDAEREFEHVHAGAQCKRATLHYDHARYMDECRRIIDVFDCSLVRTQGGGLPGAVPIFICGLPRSGTTLAEQILSSHPSVTAGDEIPALPQATAEILGRNHSQQAFPDWVPTLPHDQWQAIGRHYLELTKPLQHTAFFTDKNLQNYKAIGLIKRALPQARIVFCRRDPMDNLWGCYRQLFGKDDMPFSYSLDELADTWISARDLLAHWQQLLGDEIFVLDYETLVADQASTTRSLLDYIGLPWDDACLHFHHNTRAARTLSLTQVDKPLSDQRVGRWRRVESQLQGLKQQLGLD